MPKTKTMMNSNIFLIIDRYLAKPKHELAVQIKHLSHKLWQQAHNQAYVLAYAEACAKPYVENLELYAKVYAKIYAEAYPQSSDDAFNEAYRNASFAASYAKAKAKAYGEKKHEAYDLAYAAAVEQAKLKPSDKNIPDDLIRPDPGDIIIGGDEWGTILQENMSRIAQQAFPYSARFINNEQFETYGASLKLSKRDIEEKKSTDPKYIFRVSQEEQLKIKSLVGELISPNGTGGLQPHGLIFAYAGYIERRNSEFKNLTDNEAAVFRCHTSLFVKSQNLIDRDHVAPADILKRAYSQIIKPLRAYTSGDNRSLTEVNKCLGRAQTHPDVREHRGAKEVIANFLLTISVVGLLYLAVSASSRGTFWYHPNTDSESKLNDFDMAINPSKAG